VDLREGILAHHHAAPFSEFTLLLYRGYDKNRRDFLSWIEEKRGEKRRLSKTVGKWEE